MSALVRELTTRRLARSVVVAASTDADPGLLELVRRHAQSVQLVDSRRILDPRLLRALRTEIAGSAIAVVHSHLSTANVGSRVAARLQRLPHLTTVHTLPGPAAEDTRAHAWLDGWSSHLSTRIACPSEEIAAGVHRRYRVPRRRLTVIPNAPAAARPGPRFDREALRAELLAGAAGPLVVCVSRLQPEKGIDDLVTAAAAAGSRLPGLRVVVAGDGPQAGHLRDLALRAGDRVRLLGPRDDVGELLAAADAFCLPSRHEGVPLSMLEAMEAGVPCVVTAVGGIPDVVSDGATAFLVPPARPEALADALVAALTDHGTSARVAAAGAALVAERYSLAAMAQRYARLYRELCAA